ncbi:AraC family transcriptional regulator [Chloroflexi bacterium TSY]|nr:AraC family transcriptional regulator [Chloroflexi bacterium TSY]
MSHYERISQIKRYIREHMDEPLNRELLATKAGFSVAHFHRIFVAHVGESLSQYVRRVRMERAARQLFDPAVHVIDVALESGYETHSAFSRAFKLTFGVSPSEFRELNRLAAAHLINRRMLFNRKEHLMQPQEIRSLSDMKVLYARASEVLAGSAFQTAPKEAFGKLMSYIDANHSMEEIRHFVAIYPDEPDVGKEVRIDAGAIFVEGAEPTASDGLDYQTIPGGRWAIFRHVGPYDTLWQTWQGAYRDWLPTSGYELRETASFEDYVDDPSKVAPEKLRTDIYLPIK